MFYRINNASLSYGADVVLDRIDFEIHANDKIGLIGRNGCGKTTLLKGIIGELEFDEGVGDEPLSVIKVDNPSFGYLQQMVFSNENITLREEIENIFSNIYDVAHQLENARLKMEKEPSEDNVKFYSSLFDKFQFIGGFTLDKEFNIVLKGMGFDEKDQYKLLKDFSGGEKTRIALIELLLQKPDILLLDEPTNNLDIKSIEWLENYLINYPKALVIVSHDRMFMDRICNVIYEIEWGEMHRYNGNYSSFVDQKKQIYDKQEKDHNYQKKELARLQYIVDRFLYKPTKSKLAKSVRNKIEHTKLISAPNPYDNRSFKAQCKPAHRSSEKVLVASELLIGYERNHILQKINLNLIRGKHLGIIGPNGTGKSTFIKTIIGELPSLGGKLFWGDMVEYGYFDQSMSDTRGSMSVYDAFAQDFPSYKPQEIRNALGAFRISGDDVFKKVSELSGGEKVRFLLCKILKTRPNLLILDEPSNHVDIIGKETLESILKNYEGTIIIVSHDRYLINSTCNAILDFENNGVTYYDMTYEEYEEKVLNNHIKKPIIKLKKETKKEDQKPILIKKNNKRQIEHLANQIDDLQEQLVDLKKGFNDESLDSDYQECCRLSNDIDKIEEKINQLTEQWEKLIEDDNENGK
jgi:ATP-binding cassette subfamily F protein 3